MKIIDLLNKIASWEEIPKKIKYDNLVYEYNEQYDYKNELQINYYSVDNETDFFNNVFCYSLNDEVEILEEKKKIPEKLKWNEKSQHNVVTDNTKKTLEHLLSRSEQLKKSINQIVDYLDYLKNKGE